MKPNPPVLGAALLLVLSAAACLLALFQWMELLVVRAGGTSVCSLGQTVNCQRVWDSAFAAQMDSAFLDDLRYSKQITLPEFEKRSAGEKLIEAAAALLSRLL